MQFAPASAIVSRGTGRAAPALACSGAARVSARSVGRTDNLLDKVDTMRASHIGLALLLLPSTVLPHEFERPRLAGVKQFKVVVEDFADEAAAAGIGLTKEQVRTDVELRLREHALPVTDKAAAYVYVKVEIINLGVAGEVQKESPLAMINALHVTVSFSQPVRLVANSELASATTWSMDYIGIAGNDRALPRVSSTIRDFVDSFSNDYLAANPR